MAMALPDRWSLTLEGAADLSRLRSAPRLARVKASPDPLVLDVSRTALLIIDMQNDFIDEAGWFAAERGVASAPLRGVIKPINALARAFRAAGGWVVHVNTGVRGDLANLPACTVARADDMGRRSGFGTAREAGLGPIMQAGQWGAKSHPDIDVAQGDFTVLKHRYSGFRDNELDQMLRRLDVTSLVFTGVNLDRCVFATLMDGAFQGFDPILVRDACQTPSPAATSRAIIDLVEMLYGFTTTTDNILTALGELSTPPTPTQGDH